MSRYRVMVYEPGAAGHNGRPNRPQSWIRMVDREILPMDTKAQARLRASEIRRRHPDYHVWIEWMGPPGRLGFHLDLWRMKHPWIFPWRPR